MNTSVNDAFHGLDGADEHSLSARKACQPMKRGASSTVFMFFFMVLITSALFCWIDRPTITSPPLVDTFFTSKGPKNSLNRIEFPLKCSNNEAMAQTCMTNIPMEFKTNNLSTKLCPQHFRWIYEDLRPWKSTGISRGMVEIAKDYAHFRLVIVKGKAYVEKYRKPFQTRDVFTIWGILQLLRLYPGMVPDLELMFRCGDIPMMKKKDFQGPNATSLPSVFHYCGHDDTLGIVFPDWTFWGWPEINVKPWKSLLEDLKEGNKRTKWVDRVPYAHWRGNPYVASNRKQLMTCNVSDKYDWNARLYKQDWHKEIKQGYKNSKLQDQCTHRYKIYIEGRGWSVSEKYILACDSMTLLISPDYYDFFIRSMVPMQHYWPISARNKCRDVKFAVEWGNNHTYEAQAIGKAGSQFIQENLKMEYVYDYMFHLLTQYAKLLKFKVAIPEGAVEVCSEAMACSQKGLWKEFMLESMVKFPSDTLPCTMPPPYKPDALQAFLERKEIISRQVEVWEKENWEKLNKRQ